MTHPLPSPRPLPPQTTTRSPIQKFFLRGLFLLLPTLVTVWILVKAVGFLQDNAVKHVTRLIAWSLFRAGLFSLEAYEQHGPGLWLPSQVTAWVLCLLVVVFVGIVFGNFIGRRIWAAAENALMRLPPMRFIYPFVKQLTDFFSTDRRVGFQKVVAVEYPRKGIYSLGFVTGKAFPDIERKLNGECLSVFIPSSPTPMTGYLIFVLKADVIELPITMEEALKLVISGGVIKPECMKDGSPLTGPVVVPRTSPTEP